MAAVKTKAKKTMAKKASNLLANKGLKRLAAKELREKLSKSKKPVFILLDNEKFEISEEERRQFIQALVQGSNLKSSVEENEDLSTQDVADLLNVSRPYVVKLIDTNKLKSFKVGVHRRVLRSVALEFREKMRNEQNESLDKLAEETQKLGLEFK